jgi:uncharacterized membrane protein
MPQTTINIAPLDRFTISHFALGYLLGGARIPAMMAIGIIIGWEFIEKPLKDQFPKWFPNPTQDTLANTSLDVLAAVGGFYFHRHLERQNI